MEAKFRLQDCQIFGCHDIKGIEHIACKQFGILVEICSDFRSIKKNDVSINLVLDRVGVEAIKNG